MIDLHTHSVASDGDLTPAALVARAATRGVRILALTDHDTMAGVDEACVAGDKYGVQVVPGVELSVRFAQGSMHMLGYFTTPRPSPLCEHLRDAEEQRRRRAYAIIDRLAELGVPVEPADVFGRVAGNVGRPHIADALVAAGHCSSRADAFARFLSDRGPAYVGYQAMTPQEAVSAIRESGGVAVLAHPYSLRLPERGLFSEVQRLASRGLGGIEVYRPDHDQTRRRRFTRIARAFDLVPSGGSDFHRPGENLEPGDTGDPPLPEAAADMLLARATLDA